MQNSKVKIILALYILAIIALFFYSYTQVDLGLTLIRHPFLYTIQQSFQQIGYFQRPISLALYIFLLLGLFTLYIIFLFFAKNGNLEQKYIWKIIFIQTIILTFSYTAFSYDLFNYIFDAKIITHYHQNPYLHSAQDFPKDPMLGFMHWTQRTTPYGPIWILLTLPFSFLGFQYFLPTFFLFKLLMSSAYLLTLLFMKKILSFIKPNEETFSLVLFGLNPLVVVESLVSSHLDIVSVALMIVTIYYLVKLKIIRSNIILILSVFIKYVTIFLIPLYIFLMFFKKINKKTDWQRIFLWALIFMIIPVILESFRTNFQPWYIVTFLPLASLTFKRYFIVIPVVIISFFALLIYIPFLYTGNWNPPIPAILFWITTSGIVFSALSVGLIKAKRMLQL